MFHQVQPELSEAKPGPVIAKIRPEDHTKPDVGEARSVAITVLEAEIRHPADHKTEQILVGKQRGRHDRGEDVHCRSPFGVSHRRQINELLDRASPNQAP